MKDNKILLQALEEILKLESENPNWTSDSSYGNSSHIFMDGIEMGKYFATETCVNIAKKALKEYNESL